MPFENLLVTREGRVGLITLNRPKALNALCDALVLTECARLLQQAIDQRGFAMVDVSDDGDVAELHFFRAQKR